MIVMDVTDDVEGRKACMAIRWEVFIVEQGYAPQIEDDPEDKDCAHFLLTLDGLPAGTARVVRAGPKKGKLGRLAIAKPFRGRGLSQPLCNAVHDYVRRLGGTKVWCNSQAGDPADDGVDATGLHRRMGYVPVGERYIKEGTVHQDMVLDLDATGLTHADTVPRG